MALNIAKGVLTAPTSAGNQTISLPAAFDPKAVILWTANETAAGSSDATGVFALGLGTYRSSTVSHRSNAWVDIDASDPTAIGQHYSLSSLLFFNESARAAANVECDLVSMAASEVVVNWVDPPSNAILVHYFIIGGSSVTDALVADQTISADGTAQDITVASGFGNPDLLLWSSPDRQGVVDGAAGSCCLSFGAGYDDSNAAEAAMKVLNNVTDVAMASYLRTNIYGPRFSGVGLDGVAQLDARANWPTDGFRITKPDAFTLTNQISYLALRLDSSVGVAVGRATTITTGSTVTLTGASGKTPRGLLVFHTNVAQTDSVDIAHADLGYFGMGGYDGTNEGHAGTGDEDAAGAATTYRTHSETKALQMYTPGAAGTLAAEADASFSGSDAVLTFSDLDSVERAFGWLVLSETTTFEPTATSLPRRGLAAVS